MEFETKKALLEYLGKNPDDRKLVDRMIAKGKVYKDNGMYVLVDRGSLLDEVIRLREDVKELKKLNEKESVVIQQQVVVNSSELEEAKVQWEYWERQTRRYVDYLEKVISVTYDRVKPLLWNKIEEKSEFREHILEEVRELSKYKEE